MIKSFAERQTKALFETGKSRRWNSIARVAVRKLVQIDSVTILEELNIPPGNRLEVLKVAERGSIVFALAINGASVSVRRVMASMTWKSSTTTERRKTE